MDANKILVATLLLSLTLLTACASHPAPEPDPCYTLVLTCGGKVDPILVRDHWIDLRPPSLWMICWKRCDSERGGCVSTDNCDWEIR